ncbi:MAG: thrombospondin type 3 repeat-containing protein, partial [Flavobacteriaceae bacterium]
MINRYLYTIIFTILSAFSWANPTNEYNVAEPLTSNSSLNTCTIGIINQQGSSDQTVTQLNSVETVVFALQTDCQETLVAQLSNGEFPDGIVWNFQDNILIISGVALGDPGSFNWEITVDNSDPANTVDATTNLVLSGSFTIIEDPNASSDQDADGVPDSVDVCPDTPAGTQVDAAGCPVTTTADQDADGVPDSVDVCPDTPAGTQV